MKFSIDQEINLISSIEGPCITEKGERAATQFQHYLVAVSSRANKRSVKQAIELLFPVQVKKVSILNVKGKKKRFKETIGKRKDWKKAYVCLQSGQMIDWTQIG